MVHVAVAYALWFLSGLGALGLHRHYLGKHATGILWFFTGGMGMVGSIYDLLTLPQQCEEVNRKRLPAGPFPQSPATEPKEPLEQVILKLARKNQGMISASEAALDAKVPLEEARKFLEAWAKQGFCQLRVTTEGGILFHFPEFGASASREFSV